MVVAAGDDDGHVELYDAVHDDDHVEQHVSYVVNLLNEDHVDNVVVVDVAAYTIADDVDVVAVDDDVAVVAVVDGDDAAPAVVVAAVDEDVDMVHVCDNVYVDYFVTFCKHLIATTMNSFEIIFTHIQAHTFT